MGAPPDISELLGNGPPATTVSFCGPRDGVGDFVEEHLVDLVIVSGVGKVPGDGDAFFLMVTLAKAGFGVVEIKTPGRI